MRYLFVYLVPLVGLPALVLPISSCAATSGHSRDRTVTVSGSCSREVTTDRGAITVTAEVQNDDLKTAVRDATSQYNRVLEDVRRLGLAQADLKTSEYNVEEVREWDNNRSVSKGYRARIGLKVSTSEIQRLGEVAAVAARDDLKEVGSLTTYLSTEKLKQEQDLCLKDAAQNARSKAVELATTLGARVGEVVTLTEDNTPAQQRPVTPLIHAMMREESAPAPAPVQAGTQEISATVQVSFALK